MNKQKIRTLFVDDEQDNLTAYKRNYRRDLNVFQAVGAEEAFTILAEETIDVIVSDQRMPNMTGVEFLAQVKERSPATMRILVTGYSDIEAVIAAINNAGVFNYLTKPYTPEELLSQITQAYEVCTAKRDLERIELRSKYLFDLNQDPCLLVDGSGNLVDINHAGLGFFAIDKNSFVSQGISLITKDSNALLEQIRTNSNAQDADHFSSELVGGLGRRFEATINARAIQTPGVHEILYYLQVRLPREDVLSSIRAA